MIEKAKSLMTKIQNPGLVFVEVGVDWIGGFPLPRESGTTIEKGTFKELTFGDNFVIEQSCRYEEQIDRISQFSIDSNEMARLTLRRTLLSWSLDIPIVREGGWITDECWERVGKVNGSLLNKFYENYMITQMISEEEEKTIGLQAGLLFNKNNRGVTGPCDAVRLYCALSSQWEKFGHKREDLEKLSWREYLMLKMMIEFEGEAMSKAREVEKPSKVKVARGGKVVAGSGKRIPL